MGLESPKRKALNAELSTKVADESRSGSSSTATATATATATKPASGSVRVSVSTDGSSGSIIARTSAAPAAACPKRRHSNGAVGAVDSIDGDTEEISPDEERVVSKRPTRARKGAKYEQPCTEGVMDVEDRLVDDEGRIQYLARILLHAAGTSTGPFTRGIRGLQAVGTRTATRLEWFHVFELKKKKSARPAFTVEDMMRSLDDKIYYDAQDAAAKVAAAEEAAELVEQSTRACKQRMHQKQAVIAPDVADKADTTSPDPVPQLFSIFRT